MPNVERGEIGADHFHHGVDGGVLDDRERLLLGHAEQPGAVFVEKRLRDRLEIVARIEPRRDLADVLAERLAVAQHHRAAEHVDLRTGVVDVIFLRHLVAGEGEKVGERVAHHRAAAMADMHGAGRIGRHVFHVDLAARTDGGAPVGIAGREDFAQARLPEGVIQR